MTHSSLVVCTRGGGGCTHNKMGSEYPLSSAGISLFVNKPTVGFCSSSFRHNSLDHVVLSISSPCSYTHYKNNLPFNSTRLAKLRYLCYLIIEFLILNMELESEYLPKARSIRHWTWSSDMFEQSTDQECQRWRAGRLALSAPRKKTAHFQDSSPWRSFQKAPM